MTAAVFFLSGTTRALAHTSTRIHHEKKARPSEIARDRTRSPEIALRRARWVCGMSVRSVVPSKNIGPDSDVFVS